MKKRKRYSKRILCNLYFNFIISKPTVLILIIGLGLVITGLYFASNPFLDKIENNFYSSLNECTNLLKEANIKYQETNTNIKNTVDEVDGSISIDIL